MLQAGSLCFWLHSDLRGYRDRAWRAGQPWQKESEISPLEDSPRMPADPAATGTGPALGGSEHVPERDVRLGDELRSPPFPSPHRHHPNTSFLYPLSSYRPNPSPSSPAGSCGLLFRMADTGATGEVHPTPSWEGTGSLIDLLRPVSWTS